jgi:hypothetical protein
MAKEPLKVSYTFRGSFVVVPQVGIEPTNAFTLYQDQNLAALPSQPTED